MISDCIASATLISGSILGIPVSVPESNARLVAHHFGILLPVGTSCDTSVSVKFGSNIVPCWFVSSAFSVAL